MPTYVVTSPDGQRYEVNAPEGASEAEVMAYAQQNYRGAAPAQAGSRFGGIPVNQPQGGSRFGGVPVASPSSQYSEAQLFDKLRRADAAGDTEAAYVIADEIRRIRGEPSRQRGQDRSGASPPPPPGFVRDQPQYFRDAKGTMHEFPSDATPEEIDEATRDLDRPQGAGPTNGPWNKYAEQQTPPLPPGFVLDQQSGPWDQDEIVRPAAMSGGNPWDQDEVITPASGPDFSNVRSGSSTRHVPQWSAPSSVTNARPYNGPLLRESPRPNIQSTPANRAARAEMERRQALPAMTQTEAKKKAFQDLPMAARFAIGAGARVGAAGRGAGQLYAQAADAIAPRQLKLSDLVAGKQSRYGEAMARESQARSNDGYMQGDTAAMVGGVAGDIGLMVAPGGALTKALGTTGKAAFAGNVALGAGYSGLQPVIQGESRGRNAATGAAFGAGAHGLAASVGAVGRSATNAVAPEVREMARRARELGIPLHASQVSHSLPVKAAASAGKYLPFSGYAKAASRQQEGVNRAVGRTFGADAPRLTDDVMQQGRKRLSGQFEDIYNRNAIPIGEKGARKLVEIEREASRRLTNDEGQVLRNQLDDILSNADDGVLSGQKYQAVRTALKKAEGNDKLGIAVREMRTALDDIAADAVGPKDAATLKALRSSWANMRTTEKALQQNAGASGDIRAASLWPLIRKGSTKEMREIARMGQTLLKDPIADSGTAQRTLVYNLLMGGGSIANPALIPLIAKAAIGGATVGRAANSNSLARLLTRESRGVPTSRLAELMGAANPYVAPAAAAETNRRKQTDARK